MDHQNSAASPILSCSCGALKLPTSGQPFMTVSCYCQSCQLAARQLAPKDTPITSVDGGTPYVLFRKDHVDWSGSAPALSEHRLSPKSPTRRVVATCCGAPVFLEFSKGHWVSVYAARLPEEQRPAVEMRTMTKDAPPGSRFDDGIPSPRTHSLRFMGRLFWAWVAMGFRSPKLEVTGPPCSRAV